VLVEILDHTQGIMFILGVDSSYNVQINRIVRGIILGIIVHNIHNEEVLFFSSVYI